MVGSCRINSITCGPCTIAAIVRLHVEMLPLVTCHDVEMMHLGKVLHVLSIERELKVIGVLRAPTIIAPVVGGGRMTVALVPLLTSREVHSGIHVKVQILNAVNRIVCLNVSNQRLRSGMVVVLFEGCGGVGTTLG